VVESVIPRVIVERSTFLEGRCRSPGGATQKSTMWWQVLQGDQRARQNKFLYALGKEINSENKWSWRLRQESSKRFLYVETRILGDNLLRSTSELRGYRKIFLHVYHGRVITLTAEPIQVQCTRQR